MKIITLVFFAALAAVLLSGCDLIGGSASWRAVLPALPSHWRDTFPEAQADLLIVTIDGSASLSEVSLWTGECLVTVRKDYNTLVLFYPKPDGERLRPFGAIFPVSADETARTLSLTVAGGFVAERLYHLARRGFNIENFNSGRLLNLVEEKGGDPWDYDSLLVETRLADGDFSVYALKKLETRPASLALHAGAWFSESPASPLWAADGAGPLNIPELALGCHTLFRRGGTERVYLSVTAREVIVFEP